MGSTEVGESDLFTIRSIAFSGTQRERNKYWTQTRTGGRDESGGTRTGDGI